jgi:hypothetical protein
MSESSEHAALVELFRAHPELAARLAAQAGPVELPAGFKTRVGDPIEKPATLTPDLVVEVWDGDVLHLTIAVEIQRDVDPEKLWSWPAYLWLERHRRRSDAIVLVIATRQEVAAWARRPIRGGPGNTARVIVLGPADVPRIVELGEARTNPALAVLSAGIHGSAPGGVPVVRAAFAALHALHPRETRSYNHLVFRALPAAQIQIIIEDLMQEVQQSQDDEADPFAGWNEFIAPYLERNTARTQATTLLRQLARRGFSVPDDTRLRVLACTDVARLEGWLDRVITANDLDEVFAG